MASRAERFRDVRHQAAYAGHDVSDWGIGEGFLAATCRRCGASFDRWVRTSTTKPIPPCRGRRD